MRLRDLQERYGDPAGPDSVVRRIRTRRWEMFLRQFPDVADMAVLDLGGTSAAWSIAPVRPRHLTILNLDPSEPAGPEHWATVHVGDACAPPPGVRSRTYDLVFSNSLIEHVGGHARRAAFADVVRSFAPRYWVQTPYRYFPIEPHWVFPAFQFLPVALRGAVSRTWPLGWAQSRGKARSDAVEEVLNVELLSATEMRHYFPESTLVRERICGVTKSLIAVG